MKADAAKQTEGKCKSAIDERENTLREIVDSRYQASFDRSRLIPAKELHQGAARIIGIESPYA